VGENPFGASALAGPAARTAMLYASVAMPWLVVLHWLSVLWQRRRRRAAQRAR
jgi:hypothetical protein